MQHITAGIFSPLWICHEAFFSWPAAPVISRHTGNCNDVFFSPSFSFFLEKTPLLVIWFCYRPSSIERKDVVNITLIQPSASLNLHSSHVHWRERARERREGKSLQKVVSQSGEKKKELRDSISSSRDKIQFCSLLPFFFSADTFIPL